MNKLSPTFDSDGYPTEDTLNVIKNWDYKLGFIDLMDYVKECWEYPECFNKENIKNDLGTPIIRYEISTIGWSGNEDIIRSLRENRMFWACCWVQSRRGGHYIFEVRINE